MIRALVSNVILTPLLLAVTLLPIGCRYQKPGTHGQVTPAFYYWKTHYELGGEDTKLLGSLGVSRIYLRLFDLRWNKSLGRTEPSNYIFWASKPKLSFEIVPVIFITPEAILKTIPGEIDRLSDILMGETQAILGKLGVVALKEMQLDCDWTPSTKAIYFRLLRQIQAKLRTIYPEAIVSATIRLHQVKFSSQTGIPPVDRGTLMAYHTSSPMEFSDLDSIFEPSVADSYLKSLSLYRLPLDLALPAFSWATQFNSQKRFVRLIHGVTRRNLDDSNSFRKSGRRTFVAMNDSRILGRRVMKGDTLRLDGPELSVCRDWFNQSASPQLRRPFTLVLFDYDHDKLMKFTNGNLETLRIFFLE